MHSVGQKIRHAREAQARTLSQINSTTRIAVRMLEAIEADDLGPIPSAFLYKSFVRQFAEEVGVDYQELSADVEVLASRIPAPLMPGQGPIQPPKIAALQIGRRRSPRLAQAVLSFALALVACSGVYALWQSNASGFPEIWHTLWPASGAASNPALASASDSALPDSPAKGFTLQLSATEPAWLSIIADGKPSFSGVLQPAQTKTLEGHRSARIQTRDAGALKAVFNGKPLGALGARGETRTVLFTKNHYQVIEARPTVSSITFTQTAEMKLPSGFLIHPAF